MAAHNCCTVTPRGKPRVDVGVSPKVALFSLAPERRYVDRQAIVSATGVDDEAPGWGLCNGGDWEQGEDRKEYRRCT